MDGNARTPAGAGLILGNSMLTARGIPASGEGDLKTCLAMLIMDRFGAGGSYTEFYAMDLREQFVLMGHDGPGHIAISDRKPVLRGLGFTMANADTESAQFQVDRSHHSAGNDANSRRPTEDADGPRRVTRPTLRIGNTNSRLRFALDPVKFVKRWACLRLRPTIGSRTPQQQDPKFSSITGLTAIEVC